MLTCDYDEVEDRQQFVKQYPLVFLYAIIRAALRVLGRAGRAKVFSFIGWDTWDNFLVWWQVHFPRLARTSLPPRTNEDWLLRSLRGNIAVDVGAYLGYCVLLLSENFRRVIAIEPHPGNYQKMRKNLQKRNVRNVELKAMAIDDGSKTEDTLFEGYDGSTHTLKQSFAHSQITHKVKVSSLASLLQDMPLIDFVKVDVEGAELEVLDGATPIVSRIQRWLVEAHGMGEAALVKRKQDLQQWFQKLGYKRKWITKKHIYATRTNVLPK